MWYVSGNRDEEVFPDADRFDVTRPSKQNPHQAFGGGGPHHCLGHVLARTTLRTQIWEIYTRRKDLKVGEPNRLLSNFMNGVKRLPATWTPPPAAAETSAPLKRIETATHSGGVV
jgi:cytochrome P450